MKKEDILPTSVDCLSDYSLGKVVPGYQAECTFSDKSVKEENFFPASRKNMAVENALGSESSEWVTRVGLEEFAERFESVKPSTLIAMMRAAYEEGMYDATRVMVEMGFKES